MKKIFFKKIIYAFIVIALITNLLSFNIVHAEAKGKVNSSNIRLRSEPNTNSKVIRNLYLRDNVTILNQVGDWYHIRFQNVTGYMKAEFIDVTVGSVSQAPEKPKPEKPAQVDSNKPEPPKVEQQPKEPINNEAPKVNEDGNQEVKEDYRVLEKDTELRTFPVFYALDQGLLKKDEKVYIVDKLNKWVKVDNREGKTGWILEIDLKG